MNDRMTVLTVRGQVSVPASIRREAGMKPGQGLRWERVSDTELRVVLESAEPPAGAFAALGYARRWQKGGRSTDDVMRELREGESD